MKPRAAWPAGLALLTGALAAAALWLLLRAPQPPVSLQAMSVQADATVPRASAAPPAAVVPEEPATGARSAAEVERALYETGSLRLSTPDGGWVLDAQGRLLPALAVRRRFDHLLSAVGEATPTELGKLLRAQAERTLKPGVVDELMALWQRYLALQQTTHAHNAKADDAATWQPALDERVRVRRELLGAAWADAFYRDEEAAFREHIAKRATLSASGAAAVAPALALPDLARMPKSEAQASVLQQRRVAELGPEAAERLRQVDLAQADWERRLEATRRYRAELQQSGGLSPVMRTQALQAHLAAHFDASETLRVRAILGLDSGR